MQVPVRSNWQLISVPLFVSLILSAGFFLGCDDATLPTDIAHPSFQVSDGSSGGNPDFFFLPPLVPDPSGDPDFDDGNFNPDQPAVVRICPDALPECTSPDAEAEFTMTEGSGSEVIRVDEGNEHYIVNWHTDSAETGGYRIRVLVNELELGYADIYLASNRELRNVNTEEYIPIRDGRTLPIKFRIEYFLCDPSQELCTEEVVDAGVETPIVLEVPGLDPDEWDRVDVPAQPGGVFQIINDQGQPDTTSLLTFSVATCEAGFLEDPVSGCLEITTDKPLVALAEPAVVSICGIDLEQYPDPLLTIYRNHEGEITPLVHTHDNCSLNEPIGRVESTGLMRFARASWNAVTQPLVRVLTPQPLVASAPMVMHRGKGGFTDVFSEFEVGAPPDKFEGLVSWWSGDGHFDDLYGGNHGDLGVPEGPGVVRSFRDGVWGEAIDFWRGNILAPQADTGYDFSSLQEITVQTWIRLTFDGPTINLINRWITLAGDDTKLVLGLDHDTTPAQLHFQMGFGPDEQDIEHIRVDSELYSRCFNHVAGTYDGATMRLYLNGVEIGSNPATGVVNDGPVAEFGWGDDIESFFGALDDVAIYDRALQPSEIQQAWEAGGYGKCVNASGTTSTLSVSPSVMSAGDTATITLQARDDEGNEMSTGGSVVDIQPNIGTLTGRGFLRNFTDHGDGTYTADFIGESAGMPITIGARIDGEEVTTPLPTVTVDFTPLSGEEAELLIGDSYLTWWSGTELGAPSLGLSVAADELTASWGNFGMRDLSSEPRVEYNNTPFYSYRQFNERPWQQMYLALSATYDGLRSIEQGAEIGGPGGPDNVRAQAFGKLIQGIAHGFLALMFDQAFIFDEDVDLSTDLLTLQPYVEVMAAALGYLEEAVVVASSNNFTLPAAWINGNPLTATELIQLARSYQARFMSQLGRTPAERSAADWAAIIAHVDQGIQQDVLIDGDGNSGVWWKALEYYGAQTSNTTWARADYKTIGVEDMSGNYEAWLAEPVATRNEFELNTPDERIHPAGDSLGVGLDFQYHGPSRFPAARGTYHYSFYINRRYEEFHQAGGVAPMTHMTAVEMQLIKAEGVLRGGNLAGAANIINLTRVGRGNLAAVPATDFNELMAALIYEKRIEAFILCSGCAFFDRRGYGDPAPTGPAHHQGLVEGTPLHFPVPGRELERLGLPYYTFGGLGGPTPVAGAMLVAGAEPVAAAALYKFDMAMTAAEKLAYMRDRVAAALAADREGVAQQ